MSKQYYVDTSSLVCLARYYAPFDTERVIYNFLKAAFIDGAIGGAFPLLKRVFKECERVAQALPCPNTTS